MLKNKTSKIVVSTISPFAQVYQVTMKTDKKWYGLCIFPILIISTHDVFFKCLIIELQQFICFHSNPLSILLYVAVKMSHKYSSSLQTIDFFILHNKFDGEIYNYSEIDFQMDKSSEIYVCWQIILKWSIFINRGVVNKHKVMHINSILHKCLSVQ